MTFNLNPAAPFRLDLTVWTLRRLPVNAMDLWDGQTYSRAIGIGDVDGQNKLQRWLRLKGRPDHDQVNRILGRWAPYRGLIYFHLLLDELRRRDVLTASVAPGTP